MKDVTTFHRARIAEWQVVVAPIRSSACERMRVQSARSPHRARRSNTIAMQSPYIILFSYLPTCITRHFCPFLPVKNSTSKDTRDKIYYEAVRRRLKGTVGAVCDVSCRVENSRDGFTRWSTRLLSRTGNARKIARIYNGISYKFRRFPVRVSLIAQAEGDAIRRYYMAIKITRGE